MLEGLSSLNFLNLPVLLLVVLLGLGKLNLEFLGHLEGFLAGGADDLEGGLLSGNWDELPLLVLVLALVVHLNQKRRKR